MEIGGGGERGLFVGHAFAPEKAETLKAFGPCRADCRMGSPSCAETIWHRQSIMEREAENARHVDTAFAGRPKFVRFERITFLELSRNRHAQMLDEPRSALSVPRAKYSI